jgi:hypothetical protein
VSREGRYVSREGRYVARERRYVASERRYLASERRYVAREAVYTDGRARQFARASPPNRKSTAPKKKNRIGDGENRPLRILTK